MHKSEAPGLHHEQVFVRTGLGDGEAANPDSRLAAELRHLLILIDGRSTLGELGARYPAEALEAAVTALWQGGYVALAHDPHGSAPRKEGGLWTRLVETLSRTQPIPLPPTPAGKSDGAAPAPDEGGAPKPGLAARFTASGKFWFSHGGRQLDPASRSAAAPEPAQRDGAAGRTGSAGASEPKPAPPSARR
jgi:hypothetical protein